MAGKSEERPTLSSCLHIMQIISFNKLICIPEQPIQPRTASRNMHSCTNPDPMTTGENEFSDTSDIAQLAFAIREPGPIWLNNRISIFNSTVFVGRKDVPRARFKRFIAAHYPETERELMVAAPRC